jgi:hypothetical protein
VAIDFNKTLSIVNLSDAYLIQGTSVQKKLAILILSGSFLAQNGYFLFKFLFFCLFVKMDSKISWMKSQKRLIEIMILKLQNSEVIPSKRTPNSAPPKKG